MGLATDPADLLKRKTYTTRPMVLITAVALLAPLLVRRAARLLPVLGGAAGLLVRENTAASVRRTCAVAAPVLVTVALAGSLLGSAETVTASRAAEARARTAAHLVVTGEELTVPAPRDGMTLSATAATAVFVREEGTALVRSGARAVADPAAFAALARPAVVAGDVRDLDDRSIVVSEEWERHTVGESVDVWLGDGRPARLRIAAVLAVGAGGDTTYVTAANAPGAAVDRIDVRLGSGVRPAAAAAELRRTTGGSVRDRDAWAAAAHPRTNPRTRTACSSSSASPSSTRRSRSRARCSWPRPPGPANWPRCAWRARPAPRCCASSRARRCSRSPSARCWERRSPPSASPVSQGRLRALSAPVAVTVPWGTAGLALGACAVVAVLSAVAGCPRAVRR